MNALAHDLDPFAQLEPFNKSSLLLSISEIKKGIPRVNFKKIKLSNPQNLDN